MFCIRLVSLPLELAYSISDLTFSQLLYGVLRTHMLFNYHFLNAQLDILYTARLALLELAYSIFGLDI